MKYQRLAVLTRQLAAVFMNVHRGEKDDPIQPEDIFKTVFDDFDKPAPKLEYTPEEWEAEEKRLREKFKDFD